MSILLDVKNTTFFFPAFIRWLDQNSNNREWYSIWFYHLTQSLSGFFYYLRRKSSICCLTKKSIDLVFQHTFPDDIIDWILYTRSCSLYAIMTCHVRSIINVKCVYVKVIFGEGFDGIVANMLDWNFIVSPNSSFTITFTFGLIPLGKA